MHNQMKFITIEGGDGVGKSTYIPIIKKFLEDLGQEVVFTREPGGTTLGEELREKLLRQPMDLKTETLLMFACRTENIEANIKPALARGAWVICDRFTDSTMAYQCAGKGLPESELALLQQFAHADLQPGLTLIFDVPLNVSNERLKNSGKSLDKFETAGDDFKLRVANGYKTILKKNPTRCKLIDSSRTIEETTEEVLLYLSNFVDEVNNKKKTKPGPR